MRATTIQALMKWTDLVLREVLTKPLPESKLNQIVTAHAKLQDELIKEKTIWQQKPLPL